MIYDLRNPWQRDNFLRAVEKAIKSLAVVELFRKRTSRTLPQNSYLHVLIGYFATQYGCSIDEAKVDFFKRAANRQLFEREREGRAGRQVKYLRSSSSLDTGEMSLAIKRFRDWSASVAGVYLPAPGETEFLLHAQQEIERDREYL